MLIKKRGLRLIVVLIFVFLLAVIIIANAEASEKNKIKLNKETEIFLKNVQDKEQQKKFIIKFKNNIGESKLNKVSTLKNIDKFNVVKVKGKVKGVFIRGKKDEMS